MLELLALPIFRFSLLRTACLPACLPDPLTLSLCLRYWWFHFVHPEHLFNIIRMHYTIVISSLPQPSRSSILAFQKPWYHSSVCSLQHQILLQNKKWMFSQSFKCIPCGFLVDSLWVPCGFLVDSDFSNFFIHLLIVKSSFICVTSFCFYLFWNSYSLLSLLEELSAYFVEALPNPFMMTTSSYSIPLSASLLLDLSHGS